MMVARMDEILELEHGCWRAVVSLQGAELIQLRCGGADLLWEPDQRFWTQRAPILFPVISALRDHVIRVGGRAYPMPLHGFAQHRRFRLVERDAAGCRLTLGDDAATRSAYPFAFQLIMDYRLDDGGLTIAARIENPAPAILPAGFGFHPALRWPLLDGVEKSAHRLIFPDDDQLVCARPQDRLLPPDRFTMSLQDGIMPLHEGLFRQSGIMVFGLRSRSVRYDIPDGPALTVAWHGLPDLCLWMRPGGQYICIEPWLGFPDPVGFGGDIMDKPGLAHIAPGSALDLEMRIGFEPTPA